jgi:hypothetical protein
MRFGKVHGLGRRIGESVALAVILETGANATVVRDELCPWLSFGPDDDIVWQVDQRTQETIGSTLVEAGWEPFSEDFRAKGAGDNGMYQSSTYIVRNFSTMPADASE